MASGGASGGAAGGSSGSGDSPFNIGQRVVDGDGFRGTVRYVGPVATSKSATLVYVGVEWDDVGRGKNDGSVTTEAGQRVQYFSCDPTRGSFVKASLLSAGVGLLAALQAKYEDAKLDGAGIGTVSTTSGRDVEVEFVGEDKIRGRQALSRNDNISLQRSAVAFVDVTSALGAAAPQVRELDLRDNLLSKWADFVQLQHHFKHLEIVNLGGNKFEPVPRALGLPVSSLRVCVLSNTGLQWADACALANVIPTLEELHFCQNSVSVVTSAFDDAPLAGVFPSLRVLNLSDNLIESWSALELVGTIPQLQRLLINHNMIKDVHYTSTAFPALESLSIIGNRIVDWHSIDELDKFPRLYTLRCQENGLGSDLGPTRVRQFIIARMAKLVSLNSSEVRGRERADAERLYTRTVASDVAFRNSMQLADVFSLAPDHDLIVSTLITHPRFNVLAEKYGGDMTAAGQEGPSTLGASTAKVTLRSMAADSCTMEPVSRRLPVSLTVGALKIMLHKLFGCEPNVQSLTYRDSAESLPCGLWDDLKPLSFYGVVEGGEILMEELDEAVVAKARAEEEAAAKERMDRQLHQVQVQLQLQEQEVARRRQAAAAGSQ